MNAEGPSVVPQDDQRVVLLDLIFQTIHIVPQ